jgi:hypothetical protein
MSNFYIIYILKKLEYKFNITLEKENIKLISNYYNYNLLRIKLNKYNIFELLYFLNKLELLLYINLSKKAIINKFVITKLDINIDFSNYKFINYSFGIQGNNIKWTIQKILRQTFNIVILNNINVFKICTGDIIKIKEKKYIIFFRLYQFLSKKISFDDEKYDTLYVILEKLNYDNRYVFGHIYGQELISSYGYEQELISGQELIDKFENEDITYIKSNYLNYYNDNLSEYID